MIAETEPVVAELQGIHGAFSFPERILQKIWLRGGKSTTCSTTSS